MKIKHNKSAFTLVEILIATIIIVFATTAIMQFYLSSLFLSEVNRDETIAMSHLINVAEAIKCAPFSSITVDFPDGVSGGTTSNNYATLVGGYALRNENIIVSYVNVGSDPLEIIVRLNWQDRRGAARTRYLVTKRTR